MGSQKNLICIWAELSLPIQGQKRSIGDQIRLTYFPLEKEPLGVVLPHLPVDEKFVRFCLYDLLKAD